MNLASINPKMITATIVSFIVIAFVALVYGTVSLLTPTKESPPSVASTSPQDQSELVILTLPISISFGAELSTEQQANTSFTIQPELEVSQEWSSNDTLQLTPNQFPQESATYTVTTLYRGKPIHTFSFGTSNTTLEQLTEDARTQAEDDFLFAEAEKEFYQTYPWYAHLPIETSEYVIVYNFEKEAFRIRLTLGENALGAEIEAAKNRALDSLEAIGIDLNTYKYYVVIN